MFGTILHAARSGFTSGSRGRNIRAGRCVRWSEAGRSNGRRGGDQQRVPAKRGGRREGVSGKPDAGTRHRLQIPASRRRRLRCSARRVSRRGVGASRRRLLPFVSAGRELRVRFGGIADRIDRLDDGRLRVVDYKTGESQLEFAGVEALFNGEAKQRQSNVLQTLLYAMMLTHSEGCEAVPALYYVRRMNRPDYSPRTGGSFHGRRGGRAIRPMRSISSGCSARNSPNCSIPPCRSARPTMRSTRAVIAITGRSAGDNYPIKIENDGRNDPLPPRPHVCDSVYCRELPAAVWCRRGYLSDRCGRTFPKKDDSAAQSFTTK